MPPIRSVAARIALKTLARRYLQLAEEIHRAGLGCWTALVADLAAQLIAVSGIGTETAGQIPGHRRATIPTGCNSEAGLRHVVRGGAAARLLRPHPAAPAEPGRGPASQPGPPCHRQRPGNASDPRTQAYLEKKTAEEPQPTRSHPLPETAHRP